MSVSNTFFKICNINCAVSMTNLPVLFHYKHPIFFFKKLGFTPRKAEEPKQGMKSQEKQEEKDEKYT